nr:PREDICTED: DNA excision repair protein ERCC-6-like [Bemisia tabaci]
MATAVEVIIDSAASECQASTSQIKEELHSEDEETGKPKFSVDRSAISAIAQPDLAPELQDLNLSVYDQDVFEAAVLKQVDDALEREEAQKKVKIKKVVKNEVKKEEGELSDENEEDEKGENEGSDLNAGFVRPSNQLFSTNETGTETEAEKQIRLGEITPFGTSIDGPSKSSKKPEMSAFEKYLQDQEKLRAKKPIPKKAKTVVERSKDPLQRSVLNRSGTKKKRKKKEKLGTTKKAYCPYSESDPMASETSTMYLNEESGSEYVPTSSDASSDEEAKSYAALKESESKRPKPQRPVKKRRRIEYVSDSSVHTDDSFSDSDDDSKSKKRKYGKELDDGDEFVYERRYRKWKKSPEAAEREENLHKFDDFAIPQEIWDRLYNYQKVGVRWMWELDQKKCGGILGDEMGLGKTIQIIAFLTGIHYSQLRNKHTMKRGLGPSIIVCPTTVMHQWVCEFHKWAPHFRVAILHESGSFIGKKANLIADINNSRGIIVTSYSGIVQHKDEILDRRWHYIILDEGHKIRNPDAKVTLTVKQLRTPHRLILSGSPMQNNLQELWSLFDFIFPGKLGTLPTFLAEFATPIVQGGYANASQVQVQTAFKCATVLKDTITPFLLRRMKCDVQSHIELPEKNEQVLFCRLTDIQRDLYQNYVNSQEVGRILQGNMKIFVGLINLRKICNHPDLYSGGPKLLVGESEDNIPEEESYGHWSKSGKMIVVDTLLKIWHKQGHRVLLFTQSRQMLCIMESFLIRNDYTFLKLDGGTSISARQPLINKFNQDKSYFAMLLTTRVGGLGVNLTGANRVLIYDPDWNPATDTQARERAWRIGQSQKVTVYRLITAGTVEEKMYHRQIFKQFLCNKVLKDPRQRRFFKSNDLYELFTLKETTGEREKTETSAIFAGTGSEVKYSQVKSNYRKAKEKLAKESMKPVDPVITFSESKIEQMKRLAQELSKKLGQTSAKSDSNPEGDGSSSTTVAEKPSSSGQDSKVGKDSYCDKIEGSDNDVIAGKSDESSSSHKVCSPKKSGDPNPSEASSSREHRKKHKHKHKHKRRDIKFEGEEVPYLVGLGDYKAGTEEEEKEKSRKDDDYVLTKLFSKTGLQTAMQHDTIMGGGPADYALVEGEAERVAKQAVEALQKSRSQCWGADSGVPTWTGQSGLIKSSIVSSIKKIGTTSGAMSSADLLNKIRERNGDVKASSKELDLLNDIRYFIASNSGITTTDELIKKFEKQLPVDVTPLFKSLLTQICTFNRGANQKGYWRLKPEFK